MKTDILKLHSELKEIFNKSRRDAATFASLTILLAPVFVTISIIVFVCAIYFISGRLLYYFAYNRIFVSGVNLSVILMFLSYFSQPKTPYSQVKHDWTWIMTGLAFLCALLFLSYGTPYAKTHPWFFWSLYLFLALSMLGCLGYIYEPKESYYLGWVAGPLVFDNPFTLEDDIDRAHFSLGFAMAAPNLIISSYAEIFGSSWLWHGLEEWELSAAVEMMQLLSRKDPEELKTYMRAMDNASALRIVRALAKLGMITIGRRSPMLSKKGHDFLAITLY